MFKPPPFVAEEPELAIPVIVGYRGYETARDIKTIYDAYNDPQPQFRDHPQPFLRGSQLPDPPVRHVNPASGGVILPPENTYVGNSPQDDLPRGEDGEVDYKLILSGLSGLRNRMNRASDDLKISRDRLDVIDIQRRNAGLENEGLIELPPSGPEDEINVLEGNYADQQIISTDDQLSEEEIGLLPGPLSQPQNQPQRRSWWDRLVQSRVPLVTNPKYELPSSSTTTSTNPTVPIPSPIPVAPPPPSYIVPPEPDNFELLVQSRYIPVQQPQGNLFPIFASGMALMAFALGIPILFL